MRVLHIDLLGEFRLRYGDELVTSVNTPRLQSLLTYLLLHRQAPQSRQHIAFQFWPDSSEKQAHTNLRKLLFQLRAALPDPDQFLIQDHLMVQWRPDAPYTLDAAELQTTLDRCLTTNGKPSAQANPDDLTQVVNLYQGTLLPGCFDEWLMPLRQQLQRDVMQALEQLISLSEHQREYRAGIRYAQRLLGLDPLQESAYRRLMQLHALNGDRAAALHDYHTCATLLQQELGVEPDEETRTLYQRILGMAGQAIQPSAPLAEAPLVGRTAEWRTLLAAWRKAQRGVAHFVSLAGEAGMGKTRLAEELIAWVRAQGGLVAYARSYEAEGAVAYAPVTEWLRSPPLRTGLRHLDRVWLTEVARLLPELLSESTSLVAPTPLTQSWQQQRFFEALARALLADKGPLLLVIDDLQWCDTETLIWLRYLLRYAAGTRLLIVGAWRSEEVHEAHALRTLTRALDNANQLTALELTLLSTAETATLIQHVAQAPLDAPTVQQLVQATEGHPLFVVETVRAKLNEDRAEPVSQDDPLLPAKVQAIIQSRLAQLSTPARDLVGLAATMGRQFTFAALLHAGRLEEDELVQALDELWQRRIVREQGLDAYDFAHDKIRAVAYAQLSGTRRRLLHRRVAEALETIYAATLDEISAQLGAHYEQGATPDKAQGYFQRAGAHAARQFASQEAVDCFLRALVLTPETNRVERYHLLLALEAVYEIQGQSDARYQILLMLQQMVTNQLEPVLHLPAYRAEVSAALAHYHRQTGDYTAAVRIAQAAIALAQTGSMQAVAAKSYFVLGFAYWGQGNMTLARPALTHAVETAHALGLDALEARALEQLAATEMFSGGDAALIAAYLPQCLALYRRRGDLLGEASIFNKLGFLPFAQGEGDFAEAVGYFEQGIALSRQIGAQSMEGTLAGNLGYLYVFIGNYTLAATWLTTSLRVASALKDRMRETATLTYLGTLAAQQGNFAAAKAHHEACLAMVEEIGGEQWRSKALCGLGCLAWMRGEHQQAFTFSQAALESAHRVGDRRMVGNALLCLAHAQTGLGQWVAAVSLYQTAYTIRRELKQDNRSMEAVAGLANVAWQQADLAQANHYVEQILAHLQTHQLDRTDEALHVYMSCYRVRAAGEDGKAAAWLQRAYEQVQARAATLETEHERQCFWAAPIHAEVLVATGRSG